MSTKFRRRVGAAADVKELEYVSALHQSCMPFLREDGTVSSQDVAVFLKSRVGIVITPEDAHRVVRGLGGGLMGDDVIEEILSQANEDPLQTKEQRERRNIMDRIRVAESIGALRKRLLKKNAANSDSSQVDSKDDSDDGAAATAESLKAEIPQEVQSQTLMIGSINTDHDAVVGASVENSSSQPEDSNVDENVDVENPSKKKEMVLEEYLDLLQIMAIILIPTLARAGQEWHNPPPPRQEPPPPPPYEGIKGFFHKIHDEHKMKQKERQDAFDDSLRPHPENMFSSVFETLLKSVYCREDASPPVLNATLVRELLILHGECERAADAVLVDKMVEAASTDSGLFTEEAFVQALTADLSAWNVGCEDQNTTSFQDVFGYSNYYEKAIMEVEAEEAAEREEETETKDTSNDLNQAGTGLEDDAEGAVVGEEQEGTTNGTVSIVEGAGTEGVNAEESAEAGSTQGVTDATVNLVKGAGTEGMNMAQGAGTEGVNLVKGVGARGAKGMKAEKKVLADNQALKFVDKLLSPPEKSMHILEKGVEQSKATAKDDIDVAAKVSMNRIGTEMAAEKIEREERESSRSLKELHHPRQSKTVADEHSSGGTISEDGDDDAPYKLKKLRNLFAIDSSADIFSSSILHVGIFIFFIATSLVYAVLFQQMNIFQPQCGENFLCELVDKIILWAIFALFLMLSGYFVILPLSTGNNPMERSPLVNLMAIIIALVLTWIPYAAVQVYKERRVEEPYDNGTETTVSQPDYTGAQRVTYAVGCIVAGLIVIQFFLSVVSNRRIRANKMLSKVLLTSSAIGSGRTKRAATRKINRLLQNANDMKPVGRTPKDESDLDISEEIMINFVIRGETFEECGGTYWTWAQLLSGDLFEEEGVWIMSRLLVIQTTQLLFIGFKTYALTLFIEEAINRCEKWQANLLPDLPQWVYDFVPTPRQARLALWPAFSVAVFIMVTIFSLYLPSYVKRVIQFRCGMIPSLHSDYFYHYRKSVDLVYTNVGNALYAMFGASLLFFCLIGLAIMLFVWPATQDFMLTVLAWGLGLGITIGIKYGIETIQRYYYYSGLYRTKPRRACMAQLALECWYIGMGGGVLVARFCQFILAACFYVGRTDVPFLSNDVALFGYIFDYAPQSFVKGILVHEAHRHPYIERLLAMYMMKLKNNDFCSDAGACWRQLFVTALMPWMVRHRVFSDERLGDCRDEYNTRRREGHTSLQLNQVEEMRKIRTSLVDMIIGDKDKQSGQGTNSVAKQPSVMVGRSASQDSGIERILTGNSFVPDEDTSHYLPLN